MHNNEFGIEGISFNRETSDWEATVNICTRKFNIYKYGCVYALTSAINAKQEMLMKGV